MPTGYTHNIKDGITFKEFALQCARGFGACIDMRDQPMNVEIPIFIASDYHKNSMKEAEHEYEKIQEMTIQECSKIARQEYEKSIDDIIKSAKRNDELYKKYVNMLSEVKDWQPPTEEHTGLKEFMLQQINESIRLDCKKPEYYKKILQEKEPKSGIQWKTEKLNDLLSDIKFHKKEQQEEEERVEKRNKWIQDLKESLQ